MKFEASQGGVREIAVKLTVRCSRGRLTSSARQTSSASVIPISQATPVAICAIGCDREALSWEIWGLGPELALDERFTSARNRDIAWTERQGDRGVSRTLISAVGGRRTAEQNASQSAGLERRSSAPALSCRRS
jgi:hypothetical protein